MNNPSDDSLPDTIETDVVIIGSGTAGLAAAVAALLHGADVVIIEKADTAGGTSYRADGAFWVPNNHLMKAAGIADPKAEAISFMLSASYPAQFHPAKEFLGVGETAFRLIETFYEHGAETIEYFMANGVLNPPLQSLRPDNLDHNPLNKAPAGRALVVRKDDGSRGFGSDLVHQFERFLRARGVPILLGTAATSLVKDASGAIRAVEATRQGGPLLINARGGVIFATGGYAHSPTLLQAFQPGRPFGSSAAPTNTGDFVAIGMKAGAMLGNMTNAYRCQVVVEEALRNNGAMPFQLQPNGVPRHIWQPPGDSMILVNKAGRRVVNEKRNYNDLSRVHLAWDPVEAEFGNALLFMIYDRRTAELFGGNYPLPGPGESEDWVISAPTTEALAQRIQLALDRWAPDLLQIALAADFASSLDAQIAEYNADARDGIDRQFSRGRYPYDAHWHRNVYSIARTDTDWPPAPGDNGCVFPIDTEDGFHAIILGLGVIDTNGGPVVNELAQVIGIDGIAIPGLYGVGNCIASPNGQAYWGPGGTLGVAMTYGSIAGRDAARRRNAI